MSPLDAANAPDADPGATPDAAPRSVPTPPSPGERRSGDGSRVASPEAWNEAAVMIAGGAPLKSVAERLGCSRTTLWRVLQRSERLRTRILEERRFLAVEAAARFRGLHKAAVDAIEAAVRRGDLRAAFWVADRLGLAAIDVGDAAAGLARAEDDALWGEGPPVDPALFALGAPLVLEPDAAAPAPAPQKQPEKQPEKQPQKPVAAQTGSPAGRTGQPSSATATCPDRCFGTFHERASPLPALEFRRGLYRTSAVLPLPFAGTVVKAPGIPRPERAGASA